MKSLRHLELIDYLKKARKSQIKIWQESGPKAVHAFL